MQQTIEGFRLSPQQIRLWSLQQQNDSYRSYCSLSIEGHLHVSWLKQALETVFAREEMYRTSFKRLPAIKTPIQVVHDLPSSTWKQIDIRSCTPTEQQRLLTETAQSGLHYPFNLQEGPFSLCTLLILDEQKYVLFIHLHAIYADMATLHNLTKELAHLYHSYGLSLEQNSEVAQYAQFSEWQNALLEEEGETTDQERWQKKDFPTPSAFSLPFESKAPEQNSFSPTFLTLSIDQTVYTQIETLLTRSHSHMADFLLTCWQILLWRLTGRDDMLIGLGVTGRTYEDLTDIAGLIAKYMPFLGHLDDILTFDALLNQTHETCSELLSLYPYFSWEHLKPSTSSTINALQYPFSFDFSTQAATLVVGDISFSPRQCYCCSEPFKLKMVAVQGTADLTIEFHYDLHLFDTRDIQRLALQFTTLLKSCVQQPDARISHLDMVSHDELQQLLVTFNQTQADYPKELCVHHLFEQQVASSPDAIAVYDGDMLLTYEQLDAYANRLARHLLAIGVQPEVLIGVCLERSTALLISILGIMKSGGVYVPLDPVQPKSRLSSLVSEAALSFLLTDHNLIDHMPKIKHVVYLDADWHSLIQQSGESVPMHNPAQLAYVLYTSGSTGQPKGVMISHQGLTHYVNWCSQQYAVASGTGAPVHSSLAFDLTVTSLFAPLVVGRSVFLVPEGKGIDELSNTLRAGHDFSLVKITPAHLDLLNQQLPHEELAHIAHALIIGGEALKGESLVAWHRYAPETRLINEYGPTETVVGCCIYEVPHTYPLTGNIPIGRPIPNTQIYLLDAQMSPVPLGVSGELYIGGCALGRGYLNRADLTAASFVPHPFSTEPGARLYKTGDLARYITADGNLEYLGRCDHQVKLRGYRIELEEIEVVLSLHPSIRECVTLLREDTPGDQRLVAYILGKQPTLPTLIDSLRGYLQQQLPHYMIPTAFVVLDALPLTANGKVDRRALPAPDVRQGELTKKWIAPQTAIQELLSELWCEVLGSSHANVYDDFFKVGGHSLLATQFIARIQAVLQVEIPVRTIFEKPTIVELAQHVEQALHNGQITVAPPLVPVARMQHMPLSFAQQRLWFLHQLNKHSTAYLVPQARYLYGSLHVETLERCLTELVSRHESLRTTFIAQAGQPTQIIHPASNHCLPVIDLRNLHQDEGRRVAWQLAAQEAQSPCDLERGPLFRTHLVRLADNEHVLLITLHHIITDGWSNKVLARETHFGVSRLFGWSTLAINSALNPVCRLCALATAMVAR